MTQEQEPEPSIYDEVPVWECELCGHRNHQEDSECGNCHGVVI